MESVEKNKNPSLMLYNSTACSIFLYHNINDNSHQNIKFEVHIYIF